MNDAWKLQRQQFNGLDWGYRVPKQTTEVEALKAQIEELNAAIAWHINTIAKLQMQIANAKSAIATAGASLA